jgi:ribosomal protein S25
VARNHEDKWEERKKKDWKDRLGGLDKRQVQRIPKTIPVEERIFGRLAVPFLFEAVPLVNV